MAKTYSLYSDRCAISSWRVDVAYTLRPPYSPRLASLRMTRSRGLVTEGLWTIPTASFPDLDSANTSNRKTLCDWMAPLDLVSYRVFRCLFEQAAMEAQYFEWVWGLCGDYKWLLYQEGRTKHEIIREVNVLWRTCKRRSDAIISWIQTNLPRKIHVQHSEITISVLNMEITGLVRCLGSV